MNRRGLLKSLVGIVAGAVGAKFAPSIMLQGAIPPIGTVFPRYVRGRGRLYEITISQPLTAIARTTTIRVPDEMMKDCVVLYDTNASFLTEFETHA